MPARINGLPPLVDDEARLLILGSMPSVQSLQHRQYYAHPRNRFWELLGRVLELGDLHQRPYARRVQILRAQRIALWDVARVCRRVGSADATMTDVEANDIAGLLSDAPKIGRVYCNGRKAEDLFQRIVAPFLEVPVQVGYLPSTSPANAAWTMARLLPKWREIRTFLPGEHTTGARRDGSKIRRSM